MWVKIKFKRQDRESIMARATIKFSMEYSILLVFPEYGSRRMFTVIKTISQSKRAKRQPDRIRATNWDELYEKQRVTERIASTPAARLISVAEERRFFLRLTKTSHIESMIISKTASRVKISFIMCANYNTHKKKLKISRGIFLLLQEDLNIR